MKIRYQLHVMVFLNRFKRFIELKFHNFSKMRSLILEYIHIAASDLKSIVCAEPLFQKYYNSKNEKT